MPSVVSQLTARGLITPPSWLPDNIMFEGVQGSTAYGASLDSSDFDMIGWCIPPKDIVFPHLAGQIDGFGRQKQKFVTYQKHRVHDASALSGRGRLYDLNIYNVVHYFHLCMECNPNMIASLFLPTECIVHTTIVGNMVREKRHLFLHKGAWHRFKGYSYSQLSKMETRSPVPGSKRAATVEQYTFDTKFAYHLVRLLLEVEQILTTGDLNLRRDAELLKAIRRGEWTAQQVKDFFAAKEKGLEAVYESCTLLPWGPREDEIKQLLLDCLEEHFGSLESCIVTDMTPVLALREIAAILDRHRALIR
jgi:predicted nucleotidyltransferase